MKVSEKFALDEWLSDYPDNVSYEEIINNMKLEDNVWSSDLVTVWEVAENFPLSQVAEFIENTKRHFESVNHA
jgi:hypothetical protein